MRFLINGGGFLKIEFRDKDLELCAMDEAYAIRRMGKNGQNATENESSPCT